MDNSSHKNSTIKDTNFLENMWIRIKHVEKSFVGSWDHSLILKVDFHLKKGYPDRVLTSESFNQEEGCVKGHGVEPLGHLIWEMLQMVLELVLFSN